VRARAPRRSARRSEPDPAPPADPADAFGTPAAAAPTVEGIPPAADPDDAVPPVTELAGSGLDAESTAFVDPTMIEPPYVPEAADPVTEADPFLAPPRSPFEGYAEHPSDTPLAFDH
jgi:hypothetical protein